MSKDAENTENEKKSDKQSSKPAIILAVCILGIALLLQGGYYLRIDLSRTVEIGPFATRRYGTVQAVSSDTPYIDTKISVPEGYTRAQVYRYYKEIALTDETLEHKDTARKWVSTVRFYAEGDVDALVDEILQNLFEKMNAVEGFPGITRVYNKEDANMIGYFYDDETFYVRVREYGGNKFTNGMSYLENDDQDFTIKSGFIMVRNGMSDVRRRSVISEELIQSMGLQNDSNTYPDSLFYDEYNEVAEPNSLDWTIFRIHYHPLIQSGMNSNQCIPLLSIIVDH
ncbi:MAG: DUF2927 domain-containing protein [Lachnospiraceae bacterium]|nr:DUF2927 domain-containing protein [Lachnospiraceae bacterium]